MVSSGGVSRTEFSKLRTVYWEKTKERAFSFNVLFKDDCSLSCTGTKYHVAHEFMMDHITGVKYYSGKWF